MPLPASSNVLKKLGVRIASGEPISNEDDTLLNNMIESYDEPMARAQAIVRSAGYRATARLKTRGTLVEKLRRDPQTKLPSIQDVAGLRVTVSDRVDQDLAVPAIEAALRAESCECKTRDRRVEPSWGYRAVHIIARVDGVPVEIQIRTELQDLWAQVAERIGDKFGRQIRYGGEPDPGETDRETELRQQLVTEHRSLSDVMAELESRQAQVRRRRSFVQEQAAQLALIGKEIDELNKAQPSGSQTRARLAAVEEGHHKLTASSAETRAELEEQLDTLATVVERLKDTLRDQIVRLSGKVGAS
jgi:ppGpp synthetase/RelA/SpoT-type nucleotidyltranferase